MPIQLKCPNGHRREVGMQHAGKQVVCDDCGHIWKVPPRPSGARGAAPRAEPQPRAAAWPRGAIAAGIALLVVGVVGAILLARIEDPALDVRGADGLTQRTHNSIEDATEKELARRWPSAESRARLLEGPRYTEAETRDKLRANIRAEVFALAMCSYAVNGLVREDVALGAREDDARRVYTAAALIASEEIALIFRAGGSVSDREMIAGFVRSKAMHADIDYYTATEVARMRARGEIK